MLLMAWRSHQPPPVATGEPPWKVILGRGRCYRGAVKGGCVSSVPKGQVKPKAARPLLTHIATNFFCP